MNGHASHGLMNQNGAEFWFNGRTIASPTTSSNGLPRSMGSEMAPVVGSARVGWRVGSTSLVALAETRGTSCDPVSCEEGVQRSSRTLAGDGIQDLVHLGQWDLQPK